MTATAVLLAMVAIVPVDMLLEDRVDLIELNQFYDDNAERIFNQLLFWEWSHEDGRFNVVAWRLYDREPSLSRDMETGEWLLLWQDGDNLRRVRAKALRKSWTQYDPEMRNRELLHKARRRGLLNPNYGKSVLMEPIPDE